MVLEKLKISVLLRFALLVWFPFVSHSSRTHWGSEQNKLDLCILIAWFSCTHHHRFLLNA